MLLALNLLLQVDEKARKSTSVECSGNRLRTLILERLNFNFFHAPPDPPGKCGLKPAEMRFAHMFRMFSRPAPLLRNIFLRCCILLLVVGCKASVFGCYVTTDLVILNCFSVFETSLM